MGERQIRNQTGIPLNLQTGFILCIISKKIYFKETDDEKSRFYIEQGKLQ